MKVTFVYPDYPPAIGIKWHGYFHHGLGSISASLKHAGHMTSLIHVTEPMSSEEFTDRLKSEQPDLIGFSSTTNFYHIAQEMLGWLREGGIDVPVVFGGMHASLATEEVIAEEGVDYVCIGEGERPLVELCHRLESGKQALDVPSIWAKKQGKIYRNPLLPLLQDLDELPFADRALFDYSELANESQGIATVMASRGCPYNCTYCCNRALRAKFKHQCYVRFRSVDHVLAEIDEIRRNYPFINAINFDDDILFLRQAWFTEFTAKYKEQVGLPFHCNYRVGPHDETVLESLALAGCRHVQIGLESGNDYIRNEVLARHISSENIASAVRLAHEHGMRVEANSMVGIPGDTPQTMLDTVKLNARIAADRMFVSIFYPFPETDLYHLCAEKDYLTDRNTTSFFFDSILDLDSVSREQVLMFKRYFAPMVRFYQVIRRLRPEFVSRLCEQVLDFVLAHQLTAKLAGIAYGPALWLRRRLLPPQKNLLSEAAPGTKSSS